MLDTLDCLQHYIADVLVSICLNGVHCYVLLEWASALMGVSHSGCLHLFFVLISSLCIVPPPQIQICLLHSATLQFSGGWDYLQIHPACVSADGGHFEHMM